MHLATYQEEVREGMIERLKSQGIEVAHELVDRIMIRGFNGLEYFTNARNGTLMFCCWFRVLQDTQIDVGVIGMNPYDLVLKGFNLRYVAMSHNHALYRGFIPEDLQSDIEKAALNAFWSSAIEVLNSHYPHTAEV